MSDSPLGSSRCLAGLRASRVDVRRIPFFEPAPSAYAYLMNPEAKIFLAAEVGLPCGILLWPETKTEIDVDVKIDLNFAESVAEILEREVGSHPASLTTM